MDWGKVNKVKLILEGITVSERSCLEQIKHHIKPSLIGFIWQALSQGVLSQRRKCLSSNRKPFFLFCAYLHGLKKWKKKRNERGTIVNLDVLIAAFHFGNEHLMLRSDSQQGLLVGWYLRSCSCSFKYLFSVVVPQMFSEAKCWKVRRPFIANIQYNWAFQGQSTVQV